MSWHFLFPRCNHDRVSPLVFAHYSLHSYSTFYPRTVEFLFALSDALSTTACPFITVTFPVTTFATHHRDHLVVWHLSARLSHFHRKLFPLNLSDALRWFCNRCVMLNLFCAYARLQSFLASWLLRGFFFHGEVKVVFVCVCCDSFALSSNYYLRNFRCTSTSC